MSADAYPLFEQFLKPGARARATHELAALGADALPQLRALFAGEAKNSFGVPYNTLGQPVYCGLVAVSLLGPTARPLEPLVVETLASGFGGYALRALRALGTLQEQSIAAVAEYLSSSSVEESTEAAATLVSCGGLSHPSVVRQAQHSVSVASLLQHAKENELNPSVERWTE